jgi:hypothetical protein
MIPPIDHWPVYARVTYAPDTEVSTGVPTSNNPKLYRHQLTDHFRQNGLPALSLNYLNKISSLGEGPPIAIVWNRRPMYDPAESITWLREKVEAQTNAARERQQKHHLLRQERLERLRRQAEAAAKHGSHAA